MVTGSPPRGREEATASAGRPQRPRWRLGKREWQEGRPSAHGACKLERWWPGWPFRVPEFALVGVQAGVAIHGECARPWSAAGARPSTPPHSCRAGFLSAVTRVSRAPCLLTYNTRLPRKLVVKKSLRIRMQSSRPAYARKARRRRRRF